MGHATAFGIRLISSAAASKSSSETRNGKRRGLPRILKDLWNADAIRVSGFSDESGVTTRGEFIIWIWNIGSLANQD